jgi:hypothetical protein
MGYGRDSPAIEDLRHFPGALVPVDRDKQSRSPLTKIVGTPMYKRMRAHHSNAARKQLKLADTDASVRRWLGVPADHEPTEQSARLRHCNRERVPVA